MPRSSQVTIRSLALGPCPKASASDVTHRTVLEAPASGGFVVGPFLGPPCRLGQCLPGLGDASQPDLPAATGRRPGASSGAVGSGEQLRLFECAVWLHVLIMPRGWDRYPRREKINYD
jgi:hypothetical protein